jgi:hypothetical protein
MRFLTLLLLLLLSLVCAGAWAQFEPNAALHGESLRSWRSAASRDQMATIGDIVVKTLNITDPIDARSKSRAVHECVNKVAADFMHGEQRVVDVAVMCIAQLGYFK